MPGTSGLTAGLQPDPGIYVADGFIYYSATQFRDAQGNLAPVGLDASAEGNALGVAVSLKVGDLYLDFAASLPAAHVSATTEVPPRKLDSIGLIEGALQPLGVGWRGGPVDLVAFYSLFVLTGHFDTDVPGDLSRASLTHEFSGGGTVYFDSAHRFYLSALASYELNQRDFGTDFRRGDLVLVQDGLGVSVVKILDLGVASYELWQVTNNSGAAVPAVQQGRSRSFGVGPEVGCLVPPLRARVSLRYEHEFGVRNRPEGEFVVISLTFLAANPLGLGGTPANR
jgi:hypothetical protein